MKYITLPLSGLLALCLLFSCGKVNESIQRDVVLIGDSNTFNIPIITDTVAQLKLGEFKVNTDLDALIKKQASDFTAADIRSIRISQVNLKFSDTNKVNHLGNFVFLNARIVNGKDSLTLGSRNDIPDATNIVINLPIINGTADLKPYLINGTNTTYIVNGILQHATTKVLKATLTPTYTVTLGM